MHPCPSCQPVSSKGSLLNLALTHRIIITSRQIGVAALFLLVLQILTNGLYTPTLHRVLNTAASTPRVSVPFFYEPSFEAIVQPLPELCR